MSDDASEHTRRLETARTVMRSMEVPTTVCGSPPADLRPLDSERYVLDRLLGRGGMGEVWLARDLQLERNVAVKFLSSGFAGQPDALRRFSEERSLMGSLHHPAVPPVYDAGLNPDGLPFFVMRLVGGGRTLRQVLREGEPLEQARLGPASGTPSAGAHPQGLRLAQRVSLFRTIVLCAASAHARGLVHRDIKPDNIMVGSEGDAILLDWGLARPIDQPEWARSQYEPLSLELTELDHRTDGFVGTLGYAAPEQVRCESADDAADVYSLGAVLYELLCFRPAFTLADRSAASIADLLGAQERGPVPPSRRSAWARVPRSLEQVVMKAMAADPAHRHPSALALAAELLAYLEGSLEQELRRRHAEEATARARHHLGSRDRGSRLLPELARRADDLRARTAGHLPLAQKQELFAVEDELDALESSLDAHLDGAVNAYIEAVAEQPADPHIRAELGSLALRQVELLDDQEGADFRDLVRWRSLVETYGTLEDRARLAGAGTVAIESSPPAATARLVSLAAETHRIVPSASTLLGETPIPAHPLEMGSHVVELTLPGHAAVHYSLSLGRCEDLSIQVRLFPQDEVGEGFVHVPAGRCILGGDPGVQGVARASRRIAHLEDFFIMSRHVSCAEYLEFLQDLPIARAREHMPRGADGTPHWVHDGSWKLPEGPSSFCPRPWRLDWPVLSVNAEDAAAYASWNSERAERHLELPHADQWEKAARGADGRYFPWGNEHLLSLCNVHYVGSGEHWPKPIGSYPTSDRSMYGVLDCGGNAADWTRIDEDPESVGWAGVKGGHWRFGSVTSRMASVAGAQRQSLADYRSFRLVAYPSGSGA